MKTMSLNEKRRCTSLETTRGVTKETTTSTTAPESKSSQSGAVPLSPVTTTVMSSKNATKNTNKQQEQLQQQERSFVSTSIGFAIFFMLEYMDVILSEDLKVEDLMQSGKDTLYRIISFFVNLLGVSLWFQRIQHKTPRQDDERDDTTLATATSATAISTSARSSSPIALTTYDTTPLLPISSQSVSSASETEANPEEEQHAPLLPHKKVARERVLKEKKIASAAEQSEIGQALIAALKHLYRENEEMLLETHCQQQMQVQIRHENRHRHRHHMPRDDDDDDDENGGLARTTSLAQKLFEKSVELKAIAWRMERKASQRSLQLSLGGSSGVVSALEVELEKEPEKEADADKRDQDNQEGEKDGEGENDDDNEDENDDETASMKMLARCEEIDQQASPPVSEVVIRKTVVDINSLLETAAANAKTVEFSSKDELLQLIL